MTPLAGTKATDVIASLTPAKTTTMKTAASAKIAEIAGIDQALAAGKTSVVKWGIMEAFIQMYRIIFCVSVFL